MWLRGCTPRINREEGRFRGSEMSGVVAYYYKKTFELVFRLGEKSKNVSPF